MRNKKVINASPWPLLQFQPLGFCPGFSQPMVCDLRVARRNKPLLKKEKKIVVDIYTLTKDRQEWGIWEINYNYLWLMALSEAVITTTTTKQRLRLMAGWFLWPWLIHVISYHQCKILEVVLFPKWQFYQVCKLYFSLQPLFSKGLTDQLRRKKYTMGWNSLILAQHWNSFSIVMSMACRTWDSRGSAHSSCSHPDWKPRTHL